MLRIVARNQWLVKYIITLNWKKVRSVIVTRATDIKLRRAYVIKLALPEDRLYGMSGQLFHLLFWCPLSAQLWIESLLSGLGARSERSIKAQCFQISSVIREKGISSIKPPFGISTL